MWIIEDTRQQKGKHASKHEHFAASGTHLIHCALPFGDYALPPLVAIDTKRDMNEIAQNIHEGAKGRPSGHTRFVDECIAAKEAGCKLFILVENTNGIRSVDEVHTWINPDCVYRPKCIQGPQLEKAMKTIQTRYGCTFLFCTPEESGRIIEQILSAERKDE